MIVSAAHILQPEILLSNSGKENLDLLNEKMLAAQPETAVLLGKHGSWQADQWSLDLSDKYQIAEREFYPDFQTIETMQRELRMMEYPLTLDSHGRIHEELALILDDWPLVRLIPISACELPLDAHEQIGECMKDFLINSPKRIAILAIETEDDGRAHAMLRGVIKEINLSVTNIGDLAVIYGG
ncbi:hypothetical protein KJ611_00495 [Patescibacteria group bacterium]|nr:hypothetical protein [Patescibacteria group bacterium]MBU1705121.1 hypothetical protein [Patescibacteria group bacterium]